MQKQDKISRAAPSQKSQAGAGVGVGNKKNLKQKPAWAKTEQELEDEKEQEIDNLLEFAYELDYEKFMDDFEVR